MAVDVNQTYWYITLAVILVVLIYLSCLVCSIIYKTKCAKVENKMSSKQFYVMIIHFTAQILRNALVPLTTANLFVRIVMNILFATSLTTAYLYFITSLYGSLHDSMYQLPAKTWYIDVTVLTIVFILVIFGNVFSKAFDFMNLGPLGIITYSWFLVGNIGIGHLIYVFNGQLSQLAISQRHSIYNHDTKQAVQINERQKNLISVITKMCVIMQILVVFAFIWLISEFVFLAACHCDPYALDSLWGLCHMLVEAVSTCCYETTVFLILGMNKKWYYLLCGLCDKKMRKIHERKVIALTIQKNGSKKGIEVSDRSPMPTPTPDLSCEVSDIKAI